MNHDEFSTDLRELVDAALANGHPPKRIVQDLNSEVQLLREDQLNETDEHRSSCPLIARGNWASFGWTAGRAQRITIDDHSGEYAPGEAVTGLADVDTGDIVVTPDLFPGMVEEITSAAGLIIYDEHSPCGRGSVVAREHEVPAVIACPAVTSRIATGDVVAIDGTRGEVFRLKAEQTMRDK